jgi:hypothetical protein
MENACDKTIIVDLSAGLNASSASGSGSPQFSRIMSRKDKISDPLKINAVSKSDDLLNACGC